jgi:hypothetical protein
VGKRCFAFLVPGSVSAEVEKRGENLSAKLLTNAIYSNILLNNVIYEIHEVSLSDRGSAGMHIRRS